MIEVWRLFIEYLLYLMTTDNQKHFYDNICLCLSLRQYSVVLFSPSVGPGHPMKPHRLAVTHSLVLHYGMHKKMQVNLSGCVVATVEPL